jgi:hypothetical protein
MMQHKRSMNNVNLYLKPCYRPVPLHKNTSTTASPPLTSDPDRESGPHHCQSPAKLQNLHGRARQEKTACETSTKQAIMYGKWPVEAMAFTAASTARWLLNAGGRKKDGHADPCPCSINSWPTWIVSSMPSPYLWEIAGRVSTAGSLERQTVMLSRQLDQSP